ncbi:uncharacterized protein EV422DRAFT_245446 [Fimicolochytrium jonesii]|uniref:uncharacterized protein n=1 Tax=Fimicolochytrium jonesii TaxID=1396493 RepID=UPI0022FF42BA|nr:uncharacterized protein EV422DRAFT_245446 [Fimicolochytrium jonesii]KAI8825102.1 hypothetical protein EV422DRAFT_245446 [Fimicolochytrium jonesii]
MSYVAWLRLSTTRHRPCPRTVRFSARVPQRPQAFTCFGTLCEHCQAAEMRDDAIAAGWGAEPKFTPDGKYVQTYIPTPASSPARPSTQNKTFNILGAASRSGENDIAPMPSSTLRLSNIQETDSLTVICNNLSKFGQIDKIELEKKPTKEHGGSAIITFVHIQHAIDAMSRNGNGRLSGRVLEYFHPERPAQIRGSSRMRSLTPSRGRSETPFMPNANNSAGYNRAPTPQSGFQVANTSASAAGNRALPAPVNDVSHTDSPANGSPSPEKRARTLLIRNVRPNTRNMLLEEFFAEFGQCRVIKVDSNCTEVEFDTEKNAKAAKALDNNIFNGQLIRVLLANSMVERPLPRSSRSPKPELAAYITAHKAADQATEIPKQTDLQAEELHAEKDQPDPRTVHPAAMQEEKEDVNLSRENQAEESRTANEPPASQVYPASVTEDQTHTHLTAVHPATAVATINNTKADGNPEKRARQDSPPSEEGNENRQTTRPVSKKAKQDERPESAKPTTSTHESQASISKKRSFDDDSRPSNPSAPPEAAQESGRDRPMMQTARPVIATKRWTSVDCRPSLSGEEPCLETVMGDNNSTRTSEINMRPEEHDNSSEKRDNTRMSSFHEQTVSRPAQHHVELAPASASKRISTRFATMTAPLAHSESRNHVEKDSCRINNAVEEGKPLQTTASSANQGGNVRQSAAVSVRVSVPRHAASTLFSGNRAPASVSNTVPASSMAVGFPEAPHARANEASQQDVPTQPNDTGTSSAACDTNEASVSLNKGRVLTLADGRGLGERKRSPSASSEEILAPEPPAPQTTAVETPATEPNRTMSEGTEHKRRKKLSWSDDADAWTTPVWEGELVLSLGHGKSLGKVKMLAQHPRSTTVDMGQRLTLEVSDEEIMTVQTKLLDDPRARVFLMQSVCGNVLGANFVDAEGLIKVGLLCLAGDQVFCVVPSIAFTDPPASVGRFTAQGRNKSAFDKMLVAVYLDRRKPMPQMSLSRAFDTEHWRLTAVIAPIGWTKQNASGTDDDAGWFEPTSQMQQTYHKVSQRQQISYRDRDIRSVAKSNDEGGVFERAMQQRHRFLDPDEHHVPDETHAFRPEKHAKYPKFPAIPDIYQMENCTERGREVKGLRPIDPHMPLQDFWRNSNRMFVFTDVDSGFISLSRWMRQQYNATSIKPSDNVDVVMVQDEEVTSPPAFDPQLVPDTPKPAMVVAPSSPQPPFKTTAWRGIKRIGRVMIRLAFWTCIAAGCLLLAVLAVDATLEAVRPMSSSEANKYGQPKPRMSADFRTPATPPQRIRTTPAILNKPGSTVKVDIQQFPLKIEKQQIRERIQRLQDLISRNRSAMQGVSDATSPGAEFRDKCMETDMELKSRILELQSRLIALESSESGGF